MVLISQPGGKKCSSEFVNSLVSSNTIPSSSAAMLVLSPWRDWGGNTTRRGGEYIACIKPPLPWWGRAAVHRLGSAWVELLVFTKRQQNIESKRKRNTHISLLSEHPSPGKFYDFINGHFLSPFPFPPKKQEHYKQMTGNKGTCRYREREVGDSKGTNMMQAKMYFF